MRTLPRLLCLAMLATAAVAQNPTTFVTADPSLANEVHNPLSQKQTAEPIARPESKLLSAENVAAQPDLQPRSVSGRDVLPTATVLRLKLNNDVSTARAYPGQQFEATLTRPVEVNGRVVIPAGVSVECEVERAHGGRRISGKPSLAIKARSVRMPSGDQFSFSASVVDTDDPRHLDVDEEGRVRGFSRDPLKNTELVALTGTGAVAGAVIAGPEGLLIGTAAGAITAAGHIVTKHRDLTLPAGTELIFELDAPATASRPQMGGMQVVVVP